MEEDLIQKDLFSAVTKINSICSDIIDVGSESTRPGAKTINPKIEWKGSKCNYKF